VWVAVYLVLGSAQALAHHLDSNSDHAAWTLDPWVVAPLLVFILLYSTGTIILWRRAGVGRAIRPWQAITCGTGWLLLAGALVSPLHWAGEHLFTFHMIEHEVVMALAAPLIAVARPFGAFLWSLPKPARSAVSHALRSRAVVAGWSMLTRPAVATIVHGLAIWVWHAPGLFDAAVNSVVVHRVQHLSFLLTALLFWWALIRRSDYGVAAGHLIMTMLHTSVLGALIALTPRVLYQVQTANAMLWGLTPLEDQQLAGVVMWVPAGTVYAGAALGFAALWIMRSGNQERATLVLQEHTR
jgi:cytochrome c oxidase assembly factor CtaG